MLPILPTSSNDEKGNLTQLVIHKDSDEEELIFFSENEELISTLARDILQREVSSDLPALSQISKVCHISRYSAIQNGLDILAVSKRNWPCYHELTASHEKL